MTNTPSRGCSDVVKGEAIAPGFWAYFTKSWFLTMNGVGFLNINPKGKDNPDNLKICYNIEIFHVCFLFRT